MLENLTSPEGLTAITIFGWHLKVINDKFHLTDIAEDLLESAVKKLGSKLGESVYKSIIKEKSEPEKIVQTAIKKAAKKLKKDYPDLFRFSFFPNPKPFFRDRDFVDLILASQVYLIEQDEDVKDHLQELIEKHLEQNPDLIYTPESIEQFIKYFLQELDVENLEKIQLEQDFKLNISRLYVEMQNFSKQLLEKLEQFTEKHFEYWEKLLNILAGAKLSVTIANITGNNNIVLQKNDIERALINSVDLEQDIDYLEFEVKSNLEEIRDFFELIKEVWELEPIDFFSSKERAEKTEKFKYFYREAVDTELKNKIHEQFEYIKKRHTNLIRAILITGRPLAGKTRAVYEYLKRNESDDTIVIKTSNLSPQIFDSAMYKKLFNTFRNRRVFIFVDDADRYDEELRDFIDLMKSKAVIIVAVRTGKESFKKLWDTFNKGEKTFENYFEVTEIPRIRDKHEIEKINKELGLNINPKKFDGNIGTVILNLDEIKKRYERLKDNKLYDAYDILGIFKLYSFTHAKTNTVDYKKFVQVVQAIKDLYNQKIDESQILKAIEDVYDDRENQNFVIGLYENHYIKKFTNFEIAYIRRQKNPLLQTEIAYIEKVYKFLTEKEELKPEDENVIDFILELEALLKGKAVKLDVLKELFSPEDLAVSISLYLQEIRNIKEDQNKTVQDLDNMVKDIIKKLSKISFFQTAINIRHITQLITLTEQPEIINKILSFANSEDLKIKPFQDPVFISAYIANPAIDYNEAKKKFKENIAVYNKLSEPDKQRQLLYAYNSLIDKSPDYQTALKWLEELRKDGFKPNIVTYSSLIYRSPDYDEALKWLEELRKDGFKPDIVTYNSLIDKSPDYQTALKWLEELRKDGFKPDIVTYNSLIYRSPDYDEALKWLEELRKEGFKPNIVTYSSLIYRSPDYDEALKWLEELRKDGFKPNIVTYSSLIYRSPDYDEALKWLEELRKEGFKPDIVTYTSFLNKADTFERAKSVLQQIHSANLKPDNQTLAAVFIAATNEVKKRYKSLPKAEVLINKLKYVRYFTNLFGAERLNPKNFEKFFSKFPENYVLFAQALINLRSAKFKHLISRLLNKYTRKVKIKSPEYYNTYANFLKDFEKNFDKALDNYRQAIRLAKYDEVYKLFLAKYYTNYGLTLLQQFLASSQTTRRETALSTALSQLQNQNLLSQAKANFISAIINLKRIRRLRANIYPYAYYLLASILEQLQKPLQELDLQSAEFDTALSNAYSELKQALIQSNIDLSRIFTKSKLKQKLAGIIEEFKNLR